MRNYDPYEVFVVYEGCDDVEFDEAFALISQAKRRAKELIKSLDARYAYIVDTAPKTAIAAFKRNKDGKVEQVT